jgi:hypothetical protein
VLSFIPHDWRWLAKQSINVADHEQMRCSRTCFTPARTGSIVAVDAVGPKIGDSPCSVVRLEKILDPLGDLDKLPFQFAKR